MSTQLTMRVEDCILPAPLQFQDQQRISLAVNDFAASSTGLPRLDRGFNIKGDTAGEYEVITLATFRRKLQDRTSSVITGIVDTLKISDSERNDILQEIKNTDGNFVVIQLAANQWCDVPLCFVEKTGAADTTIDVGVV